MANGAATAALLAGPARHLLALVVGALSPGADVGVLSRAMEELERIAGGMATDRVEVSTSANTAADMDIDSGRADQMLGDAGAVRRRNPGTKRKREARRSGGDDPDPPGMFQRLAKLRILAWRAARPYRSRLVAKAMMARSRRASWKSVEQQACTDGAPAADLLSTRITCYNLMCSY